MSNLLYKYLDVKGAIMMLHYSNLMYANAMTFNDPLDCHPALIDFNNGPSRSNNVWPPDELIIKQNISRHENYRNFLWICCLSKIYDGILLWSYYNKHEGVCIGLNMEKVGKYLQNPLYGMDILSEGKEVRYTDIIQKPNYYRDYKDYFDYQVFTKAKAWAHEQEVRLYIYKPSSLCMGLMPGQEKKKELNQKEIRLFPKIGPECFESIYLGVKINKTEKDEIIQYAKKLNPNIKIYQMEIDTNSFNLLAKQEINNKLDK